MPKFLKELRLTEGRGTGIPTILKAMRENGSPEPSFETDEHRSYFTARLPIHPLAQPDTDVGGSGESARSDRAGVRARDRVGDKVELVAALPTGLPRPDVARQVFEFARKPRRRSQLQERTGMRHAANFLARYLTPLLDAGLIELTMPDSRNAPNQQYRTRILGMQVLSEWPAD